MPFLTKEDFSLVEGTEKIEVMSDFVYQIPDNFKDKSLRGIQVTVKEGFISDLASIPKVFLGIFRKLGKSRRPAVIHDYLYDNDLYGKKIADLVFLYALKEAGINSIKRKLMFYAVKYGGTLSWRRHRKRDE